MGAPRPARLYRKSSGVFYLRVLVHRTTTNRPDAPADKPIPGPIQETLGSKTGVRAGKACNRPKKSELRRTLGTKDPRLARTISLMLNAMLERIGMQDREMFVNQVWNPHSTCGWIISPDGIRADGADDHQRLLQFLEKHAELARLMLQRPAMPEPAQPIVLSNAAPPSAHPLVAAPLPMAVPQDAAPAPAVSPPSQPLSPMLTPVDGPAPVLAPTPGPSAIASPRKPHQLSAAISCYRGFYENDLKTHTLDSAESKEQLLRELGTFLAARFPLLGNNPHVHLIDSEHLAEFIKVQENRPSKRARGAQFKLKATLEGTAGADITVKQRTDLEIVARETIAARTLIKKFSCLRHFFDYAKTKLKAIDSNPMADLEEFVEKWRVDAAQDDQSFLPLTDQDIHRIFSPAQYLLMTRSPDHFWCPLVALHVGCRLAEVATLELAHIHGERDDEIWYLSVVPERAKTKNSRRPLPIPQGLIDLGFLDYIRHVRALGCKQLFPNYNPGTPTAQRKSSKNQSGHFDKLLTSVGVKRPRIGFHSFRSTVVCALLDGNVHPRVAMQLVGHQAMDEAVRRDVITVEQARSVHMTNYAHPEAPRMGVSNPLAPLQRALEMHVKPALDVAGLRRAAKIVEQHVAILPDGRMTTGWAGQNHNYGQRMIERMVSME